VAVEALAAVVVADLADGLADEVHVVDVAADGDLAGEGDKTGLEEGLAGDAGFGVNGQAGVDDRIADLVGHLVRVSFGHGLGREDEVRHAWEAV
jgi:hypothetical protein